MGKNKLFKAVVGIAAVGAVCYALKDKIKESKVYQSLDVDDKVEKVKSTVDDKVEKVKTTIKEKMPAKDEKDRDYFTLNDDTDGEEAATIQVEGAEESDASESVEDVSAKVEDLLSDIPGIKVEDTPVSEPEITEESPILYENEGLSDVSEDLDVLEEQDKLDI